MSKNVHLCYLGSEPCLFISYYIEDTHAGEANVSYLLLFITSVEPLLCFWFILPCGKSAFYCIQVYTFSRVVTLNHHCYHEYVEKNLQNKQHNLTHN